MIARITMPFRAWWYKRIAKEEKVPPDVRRYFINTGLKQLRRIKNPTPEEQIEIAQLMMEAALRAEPEILSEPRGDLLGDAVKRFGSIPLEHCATCHRPIFTHEAVKMENTFYCPDCGGRALLAKNSDRQ